MTWLIAVIVASRLSWAIITPFGVPVVPEVKIRSQTSSGRGRGHVATVAIIRVGRRRRSPGAAVEGVDGRRGEVGEAAGFGIRGIMAGAEEQVARLGAGDDRPDRIGAHPQVQRDEDSPARIAPK